MFASILDSTMFHTAMNTSFGQFFAIFFAVVAFILAALPFIQVVVLAYFVSDEVTKPRNAVMLPTWQQRIRAAQLQRSIRKAQHRQAIAQATFHRTVSHTAAVDYCSYLADVQGAK